PSAAWFRPVRSRGRDTSIRVASLSRGTAAWLRGQAPGLDAEAAHIRPPSVRAHSHPATIALPVEPSSMLQIPSCHLRRRYVPHPLLLRISIISNHIPVSSPVLDGIFQAGNNLWT